MVHRRTRAVIVVPLALLALSPHSPAMPALAAATGATAIAGGVQLALRIPDGPYFLSEVLPVSVTLTNRSGAAIQYAGSPAQALGASLSGGTRPYLPPVTVSKASSAGQIRTGTLGNGQAISTTAFVVVSASGRPVIKAQALLLKGSAAHGAARTALFSGHPPSVTIQVGPTIPFSRMLALRYQGHTVRVSGPADALAHLEYQDAVACTGSQSPQNAAPGSALWQATGATIREPACAAGTQRVASWYVVVGAPGYAVTTASFCATATETAQTRTACKQPGVRRVQL